MASIDDEWAEFIRSQNNDVCVSLNSYTTHKNQDKGPTPEGIVIDNEVECGDLYISTKTKVLFLNKSGIDLNALFWSVPVIEYWRPIEGVVNKQIKIESNTAEEYEELVKKLKTIPYYTESAIKQINNPSARRIKFKDQRKITVGVCKKDIMNCRGRVRKAFDNCFAIILRYKSNCPPGQSGLDNTSAFREIHVKIFSTGKLEIPGILNDQMLDKTREMLLAVLTPYFESNPDETALNTGPLKFLESNTEENVLINSNFNCGFFVNRDKLFAILREKHEIETSFDPCIYPGIKCKFYFNHELGFDTEVQNGIITEEDRNQKMSELSINKKYTEVSFMIFRTGSCLIVGNCTEKILTYVYDYIKAILMEEKHNIMTVSEQQQVKNKKPKQRKRMVAMTADYIKTNN